MKKFILPFMVLAVVGCKVETGTDESSRFKVINYSMDQVNFTLVRDQVLKPQCMQCHSWAGNEAEVLKRIVPGDPTNSELYKLVQSGQMPASSPRLTDQSMNLIRQYIMKLSGIQPQKPVPLEPKYSSLKANLFEKSCTRCHNPDVQAKHPDRPLLTDKESIINRYDDIVYSMTDAWDTYDNEMPPTKSNIPRVSPEVLEMFKKWKEAGFVD